MEESPAVPQGKASSRHSPTWIETNLDEVGLPPHNDDEDTQDVQVFERSQDVTSRNSVSYIAYMNRVGWTADGEFVRFLYLADYPFYQKADSDRWTCVKSNWQVAPALSILLFEQ